MGFGHQSRFIVVVVAVADLRTRARARGTLDCQGLSEYAAYW